MKEHARLPGEYVQKFARPQGIDSLFNEKPGLDAVPAAAMASSLSRWGDYLNTTGDFAPPADIPSNDLAEAEVLQGLAFAFNRS